MKREAVQTLAVGTIEVLKPKAEGGLRPAAMLAYTGAEVGRMWGRAIFDIAGVKAGAKVPFLLDHDSTQRAGFADDVELSERIHLRGFLSPSTEAGREVEKLSDEGFPWQASIQLLVSAWDELGEGSKATVNGREVMGPISIARKSRLVEGSFLMAGADEDTHAVALAAAQKEKSMDPAAFEKANPKAVAEWQKGAADAARKDLGTFLQAFPGREGWAAARFAEGDDVVQAKAALADVLQVELTAAKAEKATPPKAGADEAKLEALRAKASPGVSFDGQTAQGGDEDGTALLESLPLEQRCQIEWLASPELRAEFQNKPGAYLAYQRREAEGTAVR